MEREDQQFTGGENSGDAPSSVHWETFEESPALPFPDSFPEFSRSYSSRHRRYRGYSMNDGYSMNNDYSMNDNQNRGDPECSCFALLTTFLFLVVLIMVFVLYVPGTMKVGPNTSMLINPSHSLVNSVEVRPFDGRGLVLHGFHKDPPLDVKTTWYETHKITLPPKSHKEWVYYLNKGSRIHISYSVKSPTSSSVDLVILSGDHGLSEWLKNPSHMTSTPNTIRETGIVRKDISHSSTYYIAVGNLYPGYAGYAEVVLNITLQALRYNTSESYYNCSLADKRCSFQLLHGHAAVLTSPGRYPGVVSGNWQVDLWYEPRWFTCLVGIGGIACFLLLFMYFEKHLKRVEQETHRDDDKPSRGSSYDSASNDKRHTEDNTDKRHTEDNTDKRHTEDNTANNVEDEKFCAICFDAPKDSFFVPCGHRAACFGCATKIIESFGACPICRQRSENVRKIYTAYPAA